MRKKKIDTSSAEQFLNLETISGDLIYTQDRYVLGFLQVQGSDQHLLDIADRQAMSQRLAAALGDIKSPFQILSVPRTVDVQGMIDRMAQRQLETDSEVVRQLLEEEIQSMQQLMDDGAKEPIILIKCWMPAAPGVDRQLANLLSALEKRLAELPAAARRLKTAELQWLCRLYANLDICVPANEPVQEIPIMEGMSRRQTQKLKQNQQALLRRSLLPMGGFTFDRNTVQVGNVIGRCFGITGYPAEIGYGYLAELVASTTAICCITYYPGVGQDLAQALSKSIRQSAQSAAGTSDARQAKTYLRRVEGADKMLDGIDAKQQKIGHISVVLMPFTTEKERLAEVCQHTVSTCAALHLRCKALGNLQKEAWMHLSPYHPCQALIDVQLKQIIPLQSMTGGEPLTVTLLRDDKGCYFGQTVDGAPICVDMLYRGAGRTDSNLIAVGKAGRGKSTAIKHLLMAQYMMGTRILIIDPEREYKDLCKALGGVWLDAGGGGAKSNPLQVRAVPMDDEEEKDPLYQGKTNALAMHIHTLLVLLRFQIPSLTDAQLGLLEASVLALYGAWGITFDTDTSGWTAEQWPIMEDWYHLLQAQDDAASQELALLLRSMAVGADQFLWNGHSNVDLNAPFVVIDTNKLMNVSKEKRAAAYFNLLSLCWDAASQNRQEPCIIMADESHILFDPALPEAGLYVRNMAKRLRKYESGIWMAFQSANDLMDDRVRLCGQAVIDNSTYRLLFGCDARNLQDTGTLFHLTAAEQQLLSNAERGTALCLIGQQHLRVEFIIPEYKLRLMGNAGGR